MNHLDVGHAGSPVIAWFRPFCGLIPVYQNGMRKVILLLMSISWLTASGAVDGELPSAKTFRVATFNIAMGLRRAGEMSDRLASVHLFKIWRSRGQIGSTEVRTQNLAGAGHAVSLCRAPEDEVKSAPTVIGEADITAARIAVADASFQTEDFATSARRSFATRAC